MSTPNTEAPATQIAPAPESTAPTVSDAPDTESTATPVRILTHGFLQGLIPALSEQEYDLLRSSILAHGCLDPLKIWKPGNGNWILLDGHNRYRICMDNGIPFKTAEVKLDSLEHAKLWILENQAGRRNLTDDQRAIIWNEIREQRSKIERAQQLANARSTKAGSGSVSAKMTDTEKAKKDTRRAVATEAKLPESKLRQAQKLKKDDPDQYKKVRAGATTLRKASKSTKKKKKTAKSPPVTKQAQPATTTAKQTPEPEPQPVAVISEPEAPAPEPDFDDFFTDFVTKDRPERKAEFKVILSVASTQLKTVQKAAKSAFGDMLLAVQKVTIQKTRDDRMQDISEQISDARQSAEDFRDELNEAKDNLPENFQDSAGAEIDIFVDALETAIGSLEEAESGLGI